MQRGSVDLLVVGVDAVRVGVSVGGRGEGSLGLLALSAKRRRGAQLPRGEEEKMHFELRSSQKRQ